MSSCGARELTDSREFNPMLKTNVGPVVDEDSFAYLRPETAQGILPTLKMYSTLTHLKFHLVLRKWVKRSRNEITPKNFIFRVREFEQMEF